MSARDRETKVHPVVFDNHMVRALLEGRKTQARSLGNVDWGDVNAGDLLYLAVETRVNTKAIRSVAVCPYVA